MNKNRFYICPVCGFDGLRQPFYNKEGKPSYEICGCCGFEFGFDDSFKKESFYSYRKEWLKKGANWFNPKLKPKNWNLQKQLNNLKARG